MSGESSTDLRDLVIELRTEQRGLREKIEELVTYTKDATKDHENRIRDLERSKWTFLGAAGVLSAAVSAVAHKLL